MTSATPKPRAGEHTRWADQYDFDKSDPATRLFVAASNWVDRCEAAEAKRDLLRERERELVEALEGLCSIVQYSVNRLDAQNEQVQVAGDLAVNLAVARAALAKARP